MLNKFTNTNSIYLNLKQFRVELESEGSKINIKTLKAIINYFSLTKYFKIEKLGIDDLRIDIKEDKSSLKQIFQNKIELALEIIKILYDNASKEPMVEKENLLPFSIIEIRKP